MVDVTTTYSPIFIIHDTNGLITVNKSFRDFFGELEEIDLVPKGSEKFVTLENRQQYVNAYIDYYLNTSMEAQYEAFAHVSHWRSIVIPVLFLGFIFGGYSAGNPARMGYIKQFEMTLFSNFYWIDYISNSYLRPALLTIA